MKYVELNTIKNEKEGVDNTNKNENVNDKSSNLKAYEGSEESNAEKNSEANIKHKPWKGNSVDKKYKGINADKNNKWKNSTNERYKEKFEDRRGKWKNISEKNNKLTNEEKRADSKNSRGNKYNRQFGNERGEEKHFQPKMDTREIRDRRGDRKISTNKIYTGNRQIRGERGEWNNTDKYYHNSQIGGTRVERKNIPHTRYEGRTETERGEWKNREDCGGEGQFNRGKLGFSRGGWKYSKDKRYERQDVYDKEKLKNRVEKNNEASQIRGERYDRTNKGGGYRNMANVKKPRYISKQMSNQDQDQKPNQYRRNSQNYSKNKGDFTNKDELDKRKRINLKQRTKEHNNKEFSDWGRRPKHIDKGVKETERMNKYERYSVKDFKLDLWKDDENDVGKSDPNDNQNNVDGDDGQNAVNSSSDEDPNDNQNNVDGDDGQNGVDSSSDEDGDDDQDDIDETDTDYEDDDDDEDDIDDDDINDDDYDDDSQDEFDDDDSQDDDDDDFGESDMGDAEWSDSKKLNQVNNMFKDEWNRHTRNLNKTKTDFKDNKTSYQIQKKDAKENDFEKNKRYYSRDREDSNFRYKREDEDDERKYQGRNDYNDDEKGEDVGGVILVRRKVWGAPSPKWGEGPGIKTPVGNVFCLSTNKRPCFTFEECRREMVYLIKRHMQTYLCPDIKYNFVVGGDGRVYEGRGWKTRPGLPVEHQNINKHSIFIGMAGDYTDGKPSDIMLEARDNIIEYGLQRGIIGSDYVLYSSVDES